MANWQDYMGEHIYEWFLPLRGSREINGYEWKLTPLHEK